MKRLLCYCSKQNSVGAEHFLMQTIYLRSIDALYTHAVMFMTSFIQYTAFSRKRLSEKVHPTIPKGIGWF